MSEAKIRRLITMYLQVPDDGPLVLSTTPKRGFWVIRVRPADVGPLGTVAGWGDSEILSYTQALEAIKFIERCGGSYEDWKRERRST